MIELYLSIGLLVFVLLAYFGASLYLARQKVQAEWSAKPCELDFDRDNDPIGEKE